MAPAVPIAVPAMSRVSGMTAASRMMKGMERKMLISLSSTVYSTFTGKIIQYLKPGFHPDDIPVVHNYPQWVEAYARNGDPGEACEAMVAAAY